MPTYTPPLRDMQFVLHELLNASGTLSSLPRYADLDADTMNAILDEAGRFAAEVVQPLNLPGDQQGCKLDAGSHAVTTPDGFKEAYQQYCQGGWPALTCETEFGGQALPLLLDTCVTEMFNSANQAWTMYPGLAHGVYTAILAHGSKAQKALYLPRLTSGDWLGTMCLTEPHCGTDLGLLRTRAEPDGNGGYTLHGSKIFISAGEHDWTENIVHLVLARLPDAPAGSKGISMFIVPKFRPDADGQPGERNAIYCTAIEDKMGIHGNATCQLSLDGAQGELVGEANKGLQAMFVMMNGARLGVGNQGLALSEVACQNALAYAKERRQMRSPTRRDKGQPADPIIVHPGVRRLLLTARAWAEGGRALALQCALLMDLQLHHPDKDERARCAAQVALLTPIVKAFLTANGFAATNASMQVFGGHGYIRENGMEQFVRDARINLIYEGTNTVQALDLLGRKVLADNGTALKLLGAQVQAFIEAHQDQTEMAEFLRPLTSVSQQLVALTEELGQKVMVNPDELGAAASDYLRIAGHVVFAWLFARMAAIALKKISDGSDDAFYAAKLQTARFYYQRLLPETAGLFMTARAGAAGLMDVDAALN